MRRRIPRPFVYAPALERLGLALPPPFLGRQREIDQLTCALTDGFHAVVVGPLGSGKTRLARQLVGQTGSPGHYVRCHAGDRPEAVRARAERALSVAPGRLASALAAGQILVLDDVHLIAGDLAATFEDVFGVSHCGVVMFGRELPALPRSVQTATIELGGLDEAAARDLWAHLEETYGPTPAGSCEQALTSTCRLPLALRRAYAEAAAGGSWDIAALDAPVRKALEVVAAVSAPVAPSAVAAIAGANKVERELIELVSRQLIDPRDDGRFSAHDEVRKAVLDPMSADDRRALDSRCAEAIWADRGEYFGVLEPIDRLRMAVRHRLAAGQRDQAIALVLERGPTCVARASGGEVLGIIAEITGDRAPDGPLAHLAADVAARRGHLARALELGGPSCPVVAARLRWRTGDTGRARTELEQLSGDVDVDVDVAARAVAELVELDVVLGNGDSARDRAESALVGGLGEAGRAALHGAMAAVEIACGDDMAARAALGRAEAATGDSLIIACVRLRRAELLCREGRLRQAEALLDEVERSCADLDAGCLADDALQLRAIILARSGSLSEAAEQLEQVIARRRSRGDEIAALAAEIDLAEVHALRGECYLAVELADAVQSTASAMSLIPLADRAAHIIARIDAISYRSEPTSWPLGCARLAIAAEVAGGKSGEAARLARELVARAERTGNSAELADGLSWLGRMELAMGNRAAAEQAAGRAAREAACAGTTWAHCQALLVLAAVAREQGDVVAASSYARDAAEAASRAGLPVERLAAARAVALIAEPDGQPLGGCEAGLGKPVAAAAGRLLADLGLAASRPFLVVAADGTESRVADASPERLRMAERNLVIDGVREHIVRSGEMCADLRRRSLLKRLLFLFASSPGKTLSKEEIVEQVWQVEYHPLRHDAALFTNIMRIRRLLGTDGAELIAVSEEGYSFCPPADFVYVCKAE